MDENNTHKNIQERKSQKVSSRKGTGKGAKNQEVPMPPFAREAAEGVFQRRGEDVEIIGRNSNKEFNIKLTMVDGETKEGTIDLEDIRREDTELYKELEYNIKIHCLDHFMRNNGREVSDIRIVNGEYSFKNETGTLASDHKLTTFSNDSTTSIDSGYGSLHELVPGDKPRKDASQTLSKDSKKEFEKKLKEDMSSFGFNADNLDLPYFVEKTVLEKAKSLPEDQGGEIYDTVYGYDEKTQTWYLEKDRQIKEVEFGTKDQKEILEFNSKMRRLNLDKLEKEQNLQITSIEYTDGKYVVRDSEGGKRDYPGISEQFERGVEDDAAAGILGDGPLAREEKKFARDEKRWERFVKVFDSADQFLKGPQTDEQRSWWINYIENRKDNEFARRRAMLKARLIGKAGEEELSRIEQKLEKLIDNLKNSKQV